MLYDFIKTKKNEFASLIFLAVCFIIFRDPDLHLAINQYHTIGLDQFFKYVTYFGDGALFPVFVILFLFIKKNQSLKFVFASLLTLLITFVLKKIVFKGVPRPIEYFGAEELHLIEGVKMCHWNSFPSGHSMAAFAMFVLLFLYFKKPVWKNMMLVIAVLAAFSRVYLSQHFMVDVLVGGGIGTWIAYFSDSLGTKALKAYKKRKKKAKKVVISPFGR